MGITYIVGCPEEVDLNSLNSMVQWG
jgi:hypothetical protein